LLESLPEIDGPAVVVAVGPGGAIGRRGGLPWRAPEDSAYFKRLTTDHAVVLGRLTWESIGRPLPGRRLVVASSRALDLPHGVVAAPTPDAALDVALAMDPSPFIGGGARVYEALLPRTRRVFLTDVDDVVTDADTFFPVLDEATWTEVASWPGDGDPRLTFRVFDRRATRSGGTPDHDVR
jgi:dihydrofolate reductase